jgi:hypothetical protein
MTYDGLDVGATDELAFNSIGSTARALAMHVNMRRKYVQRYPQGFDAVIRADQLPDRCRLWAGHTQRGPLWRWP